VIHVIVVDKNEKKIVSGYADYTEFELVSHEQRLHLKDGDELKLTFDGNEIVNAVCSCCGGDL